MFRNLKIYGTLECKWQWIVKWKYFDFYKGSLQITFQVTPPQFHFNYLGEKSKKHSKEDIVVINTGSKEDSEKK